MHLLRRTPNAVDVFWSLQGTLCFLMFFWILPFASRLSLRYFDVDFFYGMTLFWIGAASIALAILGSFYCKRKKESVDENSFFGFQIYFCGILINRIYAIVLIGYLLIPALSKYSNDTIHRTPARWHAECLVASLPALVPPAARCR